MMGVVWGRTSIDFWRFDGGVKPEDSECVHTGRTPFDWDRGNEGYQVCDQCLVYT